MGDRLGTPRVVDTFLFFLFCYLSVWLGSFVQAAGPPGAFVLMTQLYAKQVPYPTPVVFW